MPMVYIWLGVFVLALIVEAAVPGLISIWFAAGALASVFTAAFGAPVGVQIAAFLVVSILSLVITRPLASKYVNSRTEPTNADRLVGRKAIVTQEINNIAGTGRITVGGSDWAARAEGEEVIIPEGTEVQIKKIAGATAIVSNF